MLMCDKNVSNEIKVSATGLIHSFVAPFDKEFWSGIKALERLIPKDRWYEEKKSLLASHKIDRDLLLLYDISENDFNREKQLILDEWEKKKKDACDRGTEIHKQLESSFKNGNIRFEQFGLGGKLNLVNDYSDLNLPRGAYSEYPIKWSDGFLTISGQIDLFVKDESDITVIDFKTNDAIKKKSASYSSATKSSQKMLYPLNKYDSCNFNEYQLQVSLYAWMLKQLHPEFNIKRLMLCHIDKFNKWAIYDCEYLEHDIKNMISYYSRKKKQEIEMNKMKPIIY